MAASNPPFFKVFFKCDDTFNPVPSATVNALVTKLIKLNLPHMMIQNRRASIHDATPNSIVWGGHFLVPGNYFKITSIHPVEQVIAEAVCIESYEDPIDFNLDFYNEREAFYQGLNDVKEHFYPSIFTVTNTNDEE